MAGGTWDFRVGIPQRTPGGGQGVDKRTARGRLRFNNGFRGVWFARFRGGRTVDMSRASAQTWWMALSEQQAHFCPHAHAWRGKTTNSLSPRHTHTHRTVYVWPPAFCNILPTALLPHAHTTPHKTYGIQLVHYQHHEAEERSARMPSFDHQLWTCPHLPIHITTPHTGLAPSNTFNKL